MKVSLLRLKGLSPSYSLSVIYCIFNNLKRFNIKNKYLCMQLNAVESFNENIEFETYIENKSNSIFVLKSGSK